MDHSRKRFLSFSGIILGIFILVFVLAEAFGFNLVAEVERMDQMVLPLAALLGLSLLIGDIFLPVPASLIMIAHGSLFGVVGGTALSLIGGILATVVGYLVGRMGRNSFEKWFGAGMLQSGAKLFARYGAFAVLITRPIPLLSETVAVVAGSTRFSWVKLLWSSALGTLPAALIYAWAGAHLHTGELGWWPFLIVIGLASLLFLIGHFSQSKKSKA